MINNPKTATPALILVISLLLLSAGCLGVINGSDNESVQITETEQGDGNTTPWSGTHFRPAEVAYNQSGFYFETYVGFALEGVENETFDDVHLCLYDGEGTVLNSTSLGTFQAPDDYRYNISISADERPRFIIVDHPKFREYPVLEVEIYTWRDDASWEGGGYFEKVPKKPDRMNETLTFEYPRDGEQRDCL